MKPFPSPCGLTVSPVKAPVAAAGVSMAALRPSGRVGRKGRLPPSPAFSLSRTVFLRRSAPFSPWLSAALPPVSTSYLTGGTTGAPVGASGTGEQGCGGGTTGGAFGRYSAGGTWSSRSAFSGASVCGGGGGVCRVFWLSSSGRRSSWAETPTRCPLCTTGYAGRRAWTPVRGTA